MPPASGAEAFCGLTTTVVGVVGGGGGGGGVTELELDPQPGKYTSAMQSSITQALLFFV